MAEQNGDERTLEWMYEGKNSEMDREAYLMGKRIKDPTGDQGDFIVKTEEEKRFDEKTMERLEYERKAREDPLFKIQKTVEEKKRELLSNPIKVKRMKETLINSLSKDLGRSFSRKSKKRSRSPSRHKSHKKHKKSSDFLKKAETSSKARHSLKEALMKQLGGDSSSSSSSDSSSSSEDERRKRKHKKSSRREEKHKKEKRHKSPERSGEKKDREEKHKIHYSSVSMKANSKYGLLHRRDKRDDSSEEEDSFKKVDLSKMERKKNYTVHVRTKPQGFTKKLTKEELEKKRREMMSNAVENKKTRKKNVKKYKERDDLIEKREAEVRMRNSRQEEKYGSSKNFMNDMRLDSVEDVVRRKRHKFSKNTDNQM